MIQQFTIRVTLRCTPTLSVPRSFRRVQLIRRRAAQGMSIKTRRTLAGWLVITTGQCCTAQSSFNHRIHQISLHWTSVCRTSSRHSFVHYPTPRTFPQARNTFLYNCALRNMHFQSKKEPILTFGGEPKCGGRKGFLTVRFDSRDFVLFREIDLDFGVKRRRLCWLSTIISVAETAGLSSRSLSICFPVIAFSHSDFSADVFPFMTFH